MNEAFVLFSILDPSVPRAFHPAQAHPQTLPWVCTGANPSTNSSPCVELGVEFQLPGTDLGCGIKAPRAVYFTVRKK